ncbi:hypothetical protein ACJRO7_036345 [Eucalyptus globulus]|uniref:Ysc84 actin-binding domain-containing protein n=1 Tax=Eucalyptus globulus TaxID=34317 RepID=A0ABD3IG40_EUCGL
MVDLELHMEDDVMSHINLDSFFSDLPEAGDVIGVCSSTNASSSSPDSGLSWFDEIENILMKDDEDGGVVSGGIRADSSQEFCDRFLADVLVDSPGDGSAEIANESGDKEEPGSSDDDWVEVPKFRVSDPQRVCDVCCVRLVSVQPYLMDQVGSLKLEKAIPDAILRQAKGFAIITVVKVGMMVTYNIGTCLMVARREDGSWSPPSAISSCGIGWGAQAGGELTDFIIVLRTTKAVKTFGGTAHFSVGAGLSAAVGPIGRAAEADV